MKKLVVTYLIFFLPALSLYAGEDVSKPSSFCAETALLTLDLKEIVDVVEFIIDMNDDTVALQDHLVVVGRGCKFKGRITINGEKTRVKIKGATCDEVRKILSDLQD